MEIGRQDKRLWMDESHHYLGFMLFISTQGIQVVSQDRSQGKGVLPGGEIPVKIDFSLVSSTSLIIPAATPPLLASGEPR